MAVTSRFNKDPMTTLKIVTLYASTSTEPFLKNNLYEVKSKSRGIKTNPLSISSFSLTKEVAITLRKGM